MTDEEAKKAARAARFGVVADPDAAAKIAARGARFGTTQPNAGGGKKRKSSGMSEEMKAKMAKRAARFGIPDKSTSQQGGGKKKKSRTIRTELTNEQKSDIREAFELLDEK